MDKLSVAIIPCTSQKSNKPAPARDVWIGAHFQLVLAHAEMFYDKVLVMSYKYGLISPDFIIEPYDIDIRTAKAADKLKWWFLMKGHIKTLSETDPLLIGMYTGNIERERIMNEFVQNGVKQVILPFEGLSVGERMSRVYDCIPPFDKEKALAGDYALDEKWLTTKAVGAGGKYMPPASQITTNIEWE